MEATSPPLGSTVPQPGLGPHYPPQCLVSMCSVDPESWLSTGHPIGLIYGDANEGRKPLSFTCVRGLDLAVNGNIQRPGFLTLTRGFLLGGVAAMIGLLYVNCLKNNNSQVTGLDPMALCVFRQFLLEAEGSPFLEADLSGSAHARVIACDFFGALSCFARSQRSIHEPLMCVVH